MQGTTKPIVADDYRCGFQNWSVIFTKPVTGISLEGLKIVYSIFLPVCLFAISQKILSE